MSNYTKTTNFATKDSLPSGDPNKIVKGAEINTEFDNIATAVSTKANSASPTFTGTVTIPTADINGGAIDGTVIGGSTAASVTGTTLTANTSLNIAGDGATVTGIKDEDDMASDSATKLATQQSIKAYVDAQVTAQDLDVTTDSGTISIDLDSETLTVAGGTGLDSSATGNTVTLGIDSTVATLTGTQTLTNKTLTAPVISGNLTTDGTIDGRDVATDGAKLDGIEANADVTDTANVTAAGALMDSEVTNLAQVKAFDSADYATAAQGTTADNALPKSGGTLTGDLNFGDNDKAIFGAGNDLTIFSDGGTFSYINNTQGILRIRNTSDNQDIAIQSDNGSGGVTDYFLADGSSGAVKLYNYGNQKLATTSTGIDVTGVITTDGMTTSADINFGDNDKAVFGAGNDLQIYHSGSESRIDENGAGNLKINADNLEIYNSASSEAKAKFNTNGSVQLYYDNAEKLATTSTGIDVTGSIVASGDLQLGNDSVASNINAVGDVFVVNVDSNNNTGGTPNIQFKTSGNEKLRVNPTGIDVTGTVSADGLTASTSGNQVMLLDSVAGATTIQMRTGSGSISNFIRSGIGGSANLRFETTGNVVRQKIDSNGDISFYEDTGTTPKFFWDASAESLGIGTSSPTQKLDISGGHLRLDDAYRIRFGGGTAAIEGSGSSNILSLITNNTERLRIDSSGRVGIGTSSPSAKLTLNDAGQQVGIDFKEAGTTRAHIEYDGAIPALELGTNGAANVVLKTSNTERMRIDSSGNVNIATGSLRVALGSDEGSQLNAWSESSGEANLAAYTLKFKTGGNNSRTERMRIDSSGNVNIGSTNSGVGGSIDLSVGNTSSSGGITLWSPTNGTHSLGFGDGYTGTDRYRGYVEYSHSDDSMRLATGSTERMRITASGDVEVKSGKELKVYRGDNATYGSMKYLTGSGGLQFNDHNSDGISFVRGGSTESMRIDSSGNVGIGTSSPTGDGTALHIHGSSASTLHLTNSTTGSAISDGFDIVTDGLDALLRNRESGAIKFRIGSSEAMRIDSSGNVGIGQSNPSFKLHVTSADANDDVAYIHHDNAAQSSGTLLKVRSDAGASNGYSLLDVQNNSGTALYVAGDNKVGIGTSSPSYKLDVFGSSAVSMIRTNDTTSPTLGLFVNSGSNGVGTISVDNGGHMTFDTGSTGAGQTERMRIDSSGNLLKRANGNIEVGGYNGGTDYGLILSPADGSTWWHMYNDAGGHLAFGHSGTVGSTERMRISSAGNLLLGQTSATPHTNYTSAGSAYMANGQIRTAAYDMSAIELNRTHSDGDIAVFRKQGTTVGSIGVSGSSTSYNTSSDQRLKENIADAEDAGSKIDAIQIRQFDWKADGSHQDYGVIAQELIEVAPEAVTEGETEDDMMAVDYSKLVPTLIKEIQSLRNRVAQLENN